jgi:hypothetical protein
VTKLQSVLLTETEIVDGVYYGVDFHVLPIVFACDFDNFAQVATDADALVDLFAVVLQEGQLAERSLWKKAFKVGLGSVSTDLSSLGASPPS